MNPGATHNRILRYLEARILGATDEEMARDLGIPQNSLRPRRAELVQMGRVKASVITGKTESGHPATIWAACTGEIVPGAPPTRAKRIAAAAEPFIAKAQELAPSLEDRNDWMLVSVIVTARAIRALAKAAEH